MAEEVDNVPTGGSDLDVLDQDTPPEQETDKELETPEKTEDEEQKEDIDKELDDFEKSKPEKEDDKILSEVRRPSLKKILAKYPNIDKEFPDIRHVFFREQKFAEVCGTVEDAKEMAEKANTLDGFGRIISEGNVELFVKSLNEPEALTFSRRILPALNRLNPDLFVEATRPLIVNIMHRAYGSSESDNMRNSVLNLCGYLFGKRELPKNIEERIDPEIERQKRALWTERQRIDYEKHQSFRGGIQEFVENKLITEILGRIDQSLPDAHKQAIANSVMDDINEELTEDNFYMSSIESLWRRAEKENLSQEWRSKIISAYLGRARQNIDSIVKRYGKSQTKSVSRPSAKSNNGEVQTQKGKVNLKSTRQISDMEILNMK